MWRNTLVMALRQIAHHRAYAAITIGGLALGLAGCLLSLGYVRYEQSYDSWLIDSARIYQVQTTIHPPGQPDVHSQASSYPLDERLPDGFAEVEGVTSIASGKTVTEQGGRPVFIDATTVDPGFFELFALPFVQGAAATALPDTNSIVLTESEAIRQFGTADVLGRRLSLGAGSGKRDYRVSGVLRDLPRNTSLRLGIIFRRDPGQIPYRGWGNFDQQHYVKLRPGADVAAVNAALPAWEKRVVAPEIIGGKPAQMADVIDFRLVPIGDVHLGEAQEAALTPGGNPRALATFAIVALLTLGMAVMNFVNLTTARAIQRIACLGLYSLASFTTERRTKEIGIGKVLGAKVRDIVRLLAWQFCKPVVLANLVAWPVAWWAMRDWLNGFDAHPPGAEPVRARRIARACHRDRHRRRPCAARRAHQPHSCPPLRVGPERCGATI